METLVVEELHRAISSKVKQTLSFEQKKLSTNAPWHFEYVVDTMDPSHTEFDPIKIFA